MKTPMHFQETAIQRGLSYNTYIADACGLGKTLDAVEIGKRMGAKKVLVVCPKSVRGQWDATIKEQIGEDTPVIWTNHIPFNFQEINAWFLIAYDELTPRGLLYPVAGVLWDLLIIDEAHRIKNHSSGRGKNLIKLTGARKICLSATPAEKNGSQLWTALHFLDPEKFPYYWPWVNKTFHTRPNFFGGPPIVGEPKNLQKLQDEISPYIIRRSKEEVMPELPEKIISTIPVPMGEEQTKLYQTIKKADDVLVQIQDQELLITNGLTLFTRLHQVSVLPSLLKLDAPSTKFLWLDEFLEDHPDQRVLVFSRYREVVEYVWQRYTDKYGVFIVMEGINDAPRFVEGEGRILAGTIDSMSEGLSLEMADAAIFLDAQWSTIKMTQAVDRIHRMNIHSAKNIYYLISSDVDRRVLQAVDDKLDETEMVLRFIHGQ